MENKPTDTPLLQTSIPFKIGAPSMLYGNSVVVNAQMLANNDNGLNFTEILLFHTPTLHNIPTPREILALKEIQNRTRTSYTVHLPASLEIASKNREVRERSIRLIIDIWLKTSILKPEYFILHIPVTPPTLVAVPGQYFKSGSSLPWDDWTSLAMESLKTIQETIGKESELLLENINYSPSFLEPFLKAGYGGFCLDVGHLLLGDENVLEVLEHFRNQIREIHMHGVKGYSEHLSLDVLPRNSVVEWFSSLKRWNFKGIINLEVFSPEDLKTSLQIISDVMEKLKVED